MFANAKPGTNVTQVHA